MFITRKMNGLLMSPETEISGGGSGEINKQASGDNDSNPADKNVEKNDYEKRIEAMEQKNRELLAEKKKAIEELTQLKSQKSEKNKQELLEKGEFEKVLAIEMEAKAELLKKNEQMELAMKEIELKAARTQQFDALKKALGSEAHDWELVKEKTNWDKFVEDKNSTYGYNEEGLKQEVERLRKTYPFFFQENPTKIPQQAAKGTSEKVAPQDRWKKSGLI